MSQLLVCNAIYIDFEMLLQLEYYGGNGGAVAGGGGLSSKELARSVGDAILMLNRRCVLFQR